MTIAWTWFKRDLECVKTGIGEFRSSSDYILHTTHYIQTQSTAEDDVIFGSTGDGATWEVKVSPRSLLLILRGTLISAPNFMTIHQIVVKSCWMVIVE